jgi:hypothetical protein
MACDVNVWPTNDELSEYLYGILPYNLAIRGRLLYCLILVYNPA